ncbi:hypothetical protein [Mesorhizobium atlanticum]|nr:hypothetical protein [Mesorhizobium atlanticum]
MQIILNIVRDDRDPVIPMSGEAVLGAKITSSPSRQAGASIGGLHGE